MNMRAVFIDMDGTLLKASNCISRRNMEAIYRLIDQGVMVFLATGRHYEVTAPYHKEIGLQTPMICLNGASIHDAETGRATQIKTVRLNEERFHHLTAESPCNVMIHTSTGLYCKETNEEIDYWTKVGQIPPQYIGDLRQAAYQDVLKYSVRTGSPSQEISALFKTEAAVIDWNDGFELVAPDVSKWAAIKSLLNELGISPNEVAAIGDGPNDIEMLRHAGTGVAMGNAGKLVKDAADFVTGHHENDGLAEFIERYLLKSYAI
ncbi:MULTISPECIES: Cof-type HAD-IIB family hydrolase [Cytobacillus]|jgi:Cof subfamily protein (haloacid dehalogenase superfamily)|uniref:Hydrolase Cof n=3 Tax=Cytobacillus TaxID=2675230 RepID=A0A160MDW8_9BACI|nr:MULTISPECIES: Cof-type HAD-IIB family hydrolase [Cytobacillus]MCS0823988.1 Cof-type HAD-IIB family hydrolase [Cytobacillus firmus]AND40698.1 hydrolase Cof [Cytobacillus oceanisediminis 2691]MBU8729666.1 Cof-type HAD-IIB family hydrolase [Cytobacillus oceanisediminis]MCM3401182.1 Cof-type HAD-IIB family hydrolase [Cytobacillus oceanisediminis]OHX50755.1 hydrolase Cof [Cytobacillus oceanisediminis]